VTIRRLRTLCLIGLAVGLLLAAVGPTPVAPVRMTAGGYTVLAGDFHVHGWPDGIPPWDAVREAHRRGLDVIALTSHNAMTGWRLWQRSTLAAGGVLVLPGEELTSVGYHMAIVGLQEPIPWHQRAGDAAAAAHAQQAAAILAHPTGSEMRLFVSDDDLRAIDGMEVAHPAEREPRDKRDELGDIYRHALTVKPIAAIGSSDFHYMAPIGVCRTYVFVRDVTAAGVIDAIRSSRTVACDGRGRAIGPAPLAAVVAERCRSEAGSPPLDASVYTRAGAVLCWLSLVGLVLLGAA